VSGQHIQPFTRMEDFGEIFLKSVIGNSQKKEAIDDGRREESGSLHGLTEFLLSLVMDIPILAKRSGTIMKDNELANIILNGLHNSRTATGRDNSARNENSLSSRTSTRTRADPGRATPIAPTR
jgi:hypothetical protein